ncbi:hypothetical protein C8T65DRAFT_701968 [Cerioporus squamosus]|nr:hypothetical protein C8T65DRAFT_701968 [Cerioporus squamosus]
MAEVNSPERPEDPHPAKRRVTRSATAAIAEDVHDAPPTSLPYNTRATNRTRRPGIDVGLNWRQERLEREAAAAEKTDRQNTKQAKKDYKAAEAGRAEQGIEELARLEAERDAEDMQEFAYLEASTARGNHKSATAKARATQHLDYLFPAESSEDDDEYAPGLQDLQEEDSESGGDVEEEEGESVRGRKPPVVKSAPPVKKKKTAKERIEERRVNMLGRIADARQAHAGKEVARPTASAAPGTANTDAFTPQYRAALQARRDLQASAPKTPLRSGSSSQHPPSSSTRSFVNTTPAPHPSSSLRDEFELSIGTPTPTVQTVALRPPSSFAPLPVPPRSTVLVRPHARVHELSDIDEENIIDEEPVIGGLQDDDVAITKQSISGRQRGRLPEMVGLAYIEPEPRAKPKPKTTRTPKADVPPSRSKSAKTLEQWQYDIYKSALVPTSIDYRGALRDPWTHDPEPPADPKVTKPLSVVELLQQLIDELCPARDCTLVASDKLVVVVNQSLRNWRRSFFSRAQAAVEAGYQEFLEANPLATRTDIKNWQTEAVHPKRGAAWWGTLPSNFNPKPSGPLLSTYIIKVFSPHFKYIANSHLEESQPPIGALSLACAAVDLAFDCYATGKYVAPTSQFDVEFGGESCDDFLEGTILPLMEKDPEAWNKLMEVARAHAGTISERPRIVKPRAAPMARKRRRRITADSSSPVRGD